MVARPPRRARTQDARGRATTRRSNVNKRSGEDIHAHIADDRARDRTDRRARRSGARAGQGRARLAHRDRAANDQGIQRHRPPLRGEEPGRQDRRRGARLDRSGRQDHGLAGGRSAAGIVARPADHLHGAAIERPAQPARRGREGDRREQYLGAGQARLQCRRQAIRPGACGGNVAADLSQGHGRQGGLEAAEDLERSPRQCQGDDAIEQGRRQDRHLRDHAAGRQSVHQHPDRRADQVERRRFVRQEQQAAAHRQEDDRGAGVLARAGQIRPARLGRARLSADVPEPLRPEGRDDVPGLRAWRRADREIRPEGDGERQDVRRLVEAHRAERQGAGRAGR